jgi:DNA-directed RNA polymerase specialized sigma24 family protein
VPEPSLLEAFRECGPPIGAPAVDEVRTRAMERVYAELKGLSRKLPYDHDTASDVVGDVLLHLVENGPRGAGSEGPTSDGGARGFLYTCLKNKAKDHLRKQRRLTTLDDPDDPIELAGPNLSESFEDREFIARLNDARRRLFDDIVPAVSEGLSLSQRDAFLESIRHRRAIAEHRITCDQCVVDSFGILSKQTRNRFDQRQGRALKRLGDGVESFILRHALPEAEADALRRVLHALKDREAFWPGPQEDLTS